MKPTNTLVLSAPILVAGLLLATLPAASAPEERYPADVGAILAKMGPDAKLELGLTKDGSIDELEFHVPYADLPQAARDALDKALPGGEVLDAEIEYARGAVNYEVTKKIDGKEAEVLVDAGGNVVSWELEVAADAVPPAVVKAVEGAAGGTVTAYEEIRDAAKKLVAYHVKKDDNGIKWKIALSPEGAVQFVRREVKAEVEVTVR